MNGQEEGLERQAGHGRARNGRDRNGAAGAAGCEKKPIGAIAGATAVNKEEG